MTSAIRAALKLLGVDRFVLGIHDASFPMRPAEDLGRGTPYSQGAEDFLRFAAAHGFTGLQLGPQGATHRGSASPYEATLFTKNPLNLPAGKLGIGDVKPVPSTDRVDYAAVFERFEGIKEALWQHLRAHPNLQPEVDAFIEQNRRWLIPDALYDALCVMHGRAYWRDWPSEADQAPTRERLRELEQTHRAEIRRHAVIQLLLRKEHQEFRRKANELGLQLFADLQIGYSAHDAWTYGELFLREYLMGAPPSRTNPEGQPWGYPVLDPRKFGTRANPGPVLEFVRERVTRILDDYDGLRIDHPHGWIDPWVYRSDDPNPLRSVQQGARLRSTPADARHPLLAEFAIARADQLNPLAEPFADDRVRSLEAAQVDAYAVLFDEIVEQAKGRAITPDAMVCEILSTLPNPIRACLERNHLGRFRVTQKAKLDDPTDVYRSENARPEDWIMVGNHDTAPIWKVVDDWKAKGTLSAHANYLSERLNGDAAFAKKLAEDRNLLVHAQLADALASPARNVYLFFADLFGMKDVYNVPGTVSKENWSLRLTGDFEKRYAEASAKHEALNLPLALSLALRTKSSPEAEALKSQLESGATAPEPREPAPHPARAATKSKA